MNTTPKVCAFPVTQPLLVHLDNVAGDITFRTTNTAECVVTLTAHSPEAQQLVDKATIAFKNAGTRDELTIEVRREGTQSSEGFRSLLLLLKNGFEGRKHSVDVDVQAPAGTSVDIKTVSGDLDLTRLAVGDVKVTAISGDITATNINGSAKFKTTSGDITVGDVRGGLKVETVSGDLCTGLVHGPIKTKAVSGDVAVSPAVVAPVECRTVSGDVRIDLVPGLAVDVNARSVSGRLHSSISLSGTPGATESSMAALNLSSVSGDITIRTLATV